MLLHETAVAWFRRKMKVLRPEVVPGLEMPDMWARRARQAVREINRDYDVAGLCREFPERLTAVRDGDGERLRE